ncbi:hypothetical protein DQR70_06605 [Salmonella enterica subsp. enterica serovar Oslo]|nr:hypothetical protein [Salmonella enterica subsp. enterica serovar Oslo]
MIRKSNNGSSAAFINVMSKIRSTIAGGLNVLPAKDKVGNIGISVENYSADDQVIFDNAIDHLEKGFQSISTEAFNLADSMSAAQGESAANQGGLHYTSLQNKNWMSDRQKEVSVESATILGLGHNSPGKYMEIQPNEFGKDVRLNQMHTSGSYGTHAVVGEDARPAMESFDETETEKWREFSYAVNLMAAKTHPFAELFYPLYVTTPENAGWLMTIRRTMVWEGFQQTELNGKGVEMRKTNALEALLEYKVLETDSTRLYPVLTDENKEWFIDDSVVAPQPKEQGADKFETQYLKFNTDHMFNLINLAQTPSRMAKGAPNFTDSLDRRIALEEVVLKVGDDVIILPVNRDTNAQFLAPREYNFRDMHLKFHPTQLSLKPENLNTDGEIPASLKALFDKGYGLTFGMKVDGEANVESGNAQVRVANVQFTGAFKLDKPTEVLALDDALIKADVPKAISAEGFSLEARLTNLNQLERGKLVDSDVQKEGFIIPTLSPICIVKPSQMDDDKVYPKIESLQFVYRTMMRNDAVTALLNRAEVLEKTLGNGVTHALESHLGMEGLGQYYYRPHFERITIDVEAELNNLTSNAKLSDIQGLIVSRMNEVIYRVNKATGYSAALEEQFPGSTPKPHVAIGTDLYLPQFIMVPGDDRTVSIGFDHTIASISDLRMSNKIVMQFTLPGEKEPHPMQSGVCGMIPEYLANFQMIRDQRIANEIRLTPRYRYFNFTCVMIVIDIVNLEEAVAKRTALNVNEKAVKAFPGEVAPTEPTDPVDPVDPGVGG